MEHRALAPHCQGLQGVGLPEMCSPSSQSLWGAIPLGCGCVTEQGSERGLATVRVVGMQGTGRPRVSGRVSQRWEVPNHYPALGREGGIS